MQLKQKIQVRGLIVLRLFVSFKIVCLIRGLVRLRKLPKVILYVSEETLPITASTENSGKEPKRIHGFTKSRIL